jgi:hypothetical protein
MGNMVYIAKKNGIAVVHANQQAMLDLDQVTPEITMTAEEYEAAGGVARIINGEIFIGKTEAETQAEENERRITHLKRKLADTDYISAKIAEGSATKSEYADAIAQRQAWRHEINDLSA